MKDKTWIIVSIIMGLALIISIGYSLELRKKVNEKAGVMVSRSIVQITASNVSIKNVITIKGTVEKKESKKSVDEEININEITSKENILEECKEKENTTELNMNEGTSYNIVLYLNEELLNKIEARQDVEIKIKNENKTFKYKGKLTKIEQDLINNRKKAIVEFCYDENIKEEQEAECTIIIEEAKDVIALPLVAIKTRKIDTNTEITYNHSNITNDQKNVNTLDNKVKEEKYVIVVNDDGTTSEVVVETGISDEYYIEIVSGLSEGQKVQIEEE